MKRKCKWLVVLIVLLLAGVALLEATGALPPGVTVAVVRVLQSAAADVLRPFGS